MLLLRPGRRPDPRPRGKSGEAGYNMVMLIMAITVLNIMVAAVLPLMSTDIQRQKEEELVFRGFQYAEAIRVFQKRFGRYPVKLTELLEMKPRSIRQLWTDPMTKDGKWGLIFQNQGGPLTAQPTGGVNPPVGAPGDTGGGFGPTPPNGQSPGGKDPNGQPPGGQQDPEGTDGGLNTPKNGEVVATGPILGVYSKSPKMSHLIFYGHQRYDEWQFTVNLLTGGAGVGPQPAGSRMAFSTRWLGRPMEFVDQAQAQPQNGTLPGQTPTPPTNTQPSPPSP
jgi:type II secretory pathway pseudopilin PulG